MGYVFDAMNRGEDDSRPEEVGKSPEAQDHGGPIEAPGNDPHDTRDTAGMESGHAGTEPSAPEESVVDPSADAHDPDAPLFNFNDLQAGDTAPALPGSDSSPTTGGNNQAPPLRLSTDWMQQLDDRLVSLTEPSSQLAEEYRGIRTSLLARWEHRRNLIHTITSATPQEGKTITSLNLGLSLAELRNRKTIVIEGDLRLPTFNKLLHLGESKGMIGYLRGEAKLGEVIQKLEGTALHVITSGSRASNDAVQLLSNNRMAKLLDILKTKYDHVIIDTPPVIELADAGILGGLSDEVMLIARISRTPKPLIEQALRALRSYNAPVAGVIATDQDRGRNRYHYYRYGYRYRYRYYAKRAA